MSGLKRFIAPLSAGLALYVIFLVASVPSAWLGAAVRRWSGGRAVLSSCRGTIWNGEADATLGTAGSDPMTTDVRWQIHPLWIGLGRLRADVRLAGPTAQGRATVEVRRKGAALTDSVLEFPAELLSGASPALAALSLRGNIHLETARFRIFASRAEGELHARWADAGAVFNASSPLGSYRAVLSGMGATAEALVETEQGDVPVQGRGRWDLSTGQAEFEGTVKGTETRWSGVAPAWIGRFF